MANRVPNKSIDQNSAGIESLVPFLGALAQADDGSSGSLEILGKGNRVVRLTSNVARGGSLVTFSNEGNEIVRLGATDAGGLIEVLNKTLQSRKSEPHDLCR